MTKSPHGIRGALVGAAVLLLLAFAPATSDAMPLQDAAQLKAPELEIRTGIIAYAGTVDDCRQGPFQSAAEVVIGQEFTWCIEVLNPSAQTATNVILVSPALRDGPWQLADLPSGQRFLFAATDSGTTDRSAQTSVTAKIGGRPIIAEGMGRAFTVAPAALTGQLTADPERSQPVAGATVLLRGADRSGFVIDRQETTAANGTYKFEDLTPSAPGGYILTVSSLPESVAQPEDPNRGLRRRVEMLPGDLVRADITVVADNLDIAPSTPEILAFETKTASQSVSPVTASGSLASPAPASPALASPAPSSPSLASPLALGTALSVALLAVLFGLLRSVPGADRRQPRVPHQSRRSR